MSQQTLGIIVGGLIPAVLYGASSLLMKAGNQSGIGIGLQLVIAGAAVVAVGAAFLPFSPLGSSPASMWYSVGFGIAWGLGTALVAIAYTRYHATVAQLVPLFNTNTLVSVLLALWIFSEWKQVHVGRLLLGAAFIVIGGALVSM